jgi:pantoate--beta-alanine ligase
VRVLSSPEEMFQQSDSWRKHGHKIGLVPTMGCLHDGHLSLVHLARANTDKVILTLFVNPMQFGPGEDLDSYPRQFDKDCRLAKDAGVDLIFAPERQTMYGSHFQTTVSLSDVTVGMEGDGRPGHFNGVSTVVSKLFNITAPHVAVFGEKDYQQLALIRQLVQDLNFQLEIYGGPIVREADGLAMSSRNKYLGKEDRQAALSLSNAIRQSKKLVTEASTPVPCETITSGVHRIVTGAGAKLEYANIVHALSLQSQQTVNSESRLIIAATIAGKVRLLDNGLLPG